MTLKKKGIAPISCLQRQPKVKILSLLWRGGEQRGVKQEFEAVSGSIFSSSLYFFKCIKYILKGINPAALQLTYDLNGRSYVHFIGNYERLFIGCL